MTQTDFDRLANEIERAYASSDIKRYAEKHGHTWHWDLPTRPIRHSVLILGFNPGAEANIRYGPQVKPCNEGFLDACNKVNGQDSGSLKQIPRYLKKYPKHFSENVIEQMGQANYCFFRSKNSGQITDHDVHLCEPIFQRFLTMAEPSKILCFSSRAQHSLVKSVEALVESPPFSFQRAQSTVTYQSARGVVSLENKTVPVYFLPHPNYRIPRTVRDPAWEFCFGSE